jgi:16S rRNA processing protein RimM
MDRERVVIAEVLRPRGNRGEMLVLAQTDVPGRIEQLKSATARLTDGSDVPVEISRAWPHRGDWVVKLAGVDSIEAAQRFRGADLWVPFTDRGILAGGDFFRSDLVGCEVFDRATGERLGTVEGWQQYGGPPLMEVTIQGREVLIPFVKALCDVDLGQGTIRVDLPEGLLDL